MELVNKLQEDREEKKGGRREFWKWLHLMWVPGSVSKLGGRGDGFFCLASHTHSFCPLKETLQMWAVLSVSCLIGQGSPLREEKGKVMGAVDKVLKLVIQDRRWIFRFLWFE